MPYYYSNEIVFRGHPDKVADQISDAILDAYIKQDSYSRCAIETVGGKGKIFITGEVTSFANIDDEDIERIVHNTLFIIGYNPDAYQIINNIGTQSLDIAQGIVSGGAGDQGMMFGYACRDTKQYLPTAMIILQTLSHFYDNLRLIDKRFLPDGKAQITGVYSEDKKLIGIKDFTISYQNTEIERETTDKILIDYVNDLCGEYGLTVQNFHINPTGKFLIGGFEGDSGLTGRKIVVDSYHSFAPVGGGAFSGKDPTKVDRSAAYKARQIAIRYLQSHEDVDWCEVQLSYAIGIDKPLSIYIKTNLGNVTVPENTSLYSECTPNNIIRDLDLRNIKYESTAQFGHFGNGVFSWERA